MSNVHHLAMRTLCLAIALANICPISGQQAILELSDTISRPGQVCAITAKNPFEAQQTYYVAFGNKRVQALGTDEAGRLWVQIPLVDPGVVGVKVYHEMDTWSGKNIQILPEPARTLTMQGSKNGTFKLLHSAPAPAWWTAQPGGYQPHLAYDLIDNQGRLVYSTVIANPLEYGDEVFEGPEKPLFRQAVPETVQFTLLIPNLPKLTEIRFYQVPFGVEGRSPEGFQQRIYVGNCFF